VLRGKYKYLHLCFVELMLISKDGASNIDSDDENLCKINWGVLGLNHI
jgi:hypothetical protein